MIAEWELWACADEMIRRHGADAAIEAAMKADELLEAGEIEGSRIWRLIMHRISELEAGPQTRPN